MKKRQSTYFYSVSALFLGCWIMSPISPLHADAFDITKPYVLSAASGNTEHTAAVGLEEEISVTIVNGGKLIDEAREQNKNIILYLDRMPLKGIYPDSYTINREKGDLHFFISHSEGPIALWDHLISTRKPGELFACKVSLSVGLEDQIAIPTLVKGDNAFTLTLVRKSWFTVCIILLVALFILFLALAVKSDILRDVGPNPDTGRKPFSLALVQMAVWFFVIMASWLLLYVVKHTFNTITDTLVTMMGISAGTGLGGVAIDTNRDRPVKQSQGFLKDILSDEYGISLHRFQIFAWTIVMVAVFIRQVTAYLKMPDFDSSLLILMGISSGTYLGFKVTEKPGSRKGAAKQKAAT
jgi:hypothetical protein